MMEALDSLGIKGIGNRDYMTRHVICATVIRQLLSYGFSDTKVALLSGHRQLLSLKSYQRLNGLLGKLMQCAILDGNEPQSKRIASAGIEVSSVDKNQSTSQSTPANNQAPALGSAIHGLVAICKELIAHK